MYRVVDENSSEELEELQFNHDCLVNIHTQEGYFCFALLYLTLDRQLL